MWREQVSFRFLPQTLELTGSVRLVGYWVSQRYFEDYADQIREDFAFRDPPSGRSRELAERIGESTAVSVHVRRGDYVENPALRAFHGVLPVDYYVAAAARIRDAVPDPHFYVFSDDPDWCRSNLELGAPTTVVVDNRRAWQRRPAVDEPLRTPRHREQLLQLVGRLAQSCGPTRS